MNLPQPVQAGIAAAPSNGHGEARRADGRLSFRMVSAAVRAVRGLYKPGYLYHKCGVILIDLQPKVVQQLDLFDDAPTLVSAGTTARERLMLTLDKVNRKEGRGTMRFASEGVDHSWKMRREKVSPAYTTRWEEIPVARA